MFLLTHPQVKAFLATIRDVPFDAGVREVYADWLEQSGHIKAARAQREYAILFKKAIYKQLYPKPCHGKLLGFFRVNDKVYYVLPNGKIRQGKPKGHKRPTPVSVEKNLRARHLKQRQRVFAHRQTVNDNLW